MAGCNEPRGVNSRTGKLIAKCDAHAEEHRSRCKESYKRQVKRKRAIGQQKVTIDELKQALVDERIATKRARRRLNDIQKQHDEFISTVTATASPNTPKGEMIVFTLLNKMHQTINELINSLETQESYRSQLKDMTTNYDKLVEKHMETTRRLSQLEGKLLTQKQLVALLSKRK